MEKLITVTQKWYDKLENKFHIVFDSVIDDEDFYKSEQNVKWVDPLGSIKSFERTYDTFEEFYEAAEKNLEDTNLMNYDISQLKNYHEYDFSNAAISSKNEKLLGIYDDTLFKCLQNIDDSSREASHVETFKSYSESINSDTTKRTNTDVLMLYLSNLNIDIELKKRFPDSINEDEASTFIADYLMEIRKNLESDFDYKDFYRYHIIIAGNIARCFKIYSMFFHLFAKVFPYRTFVVLGKEDIIGAQDYYNNQDDNPDHSMLENIEDVYHFFEEYFSFLSKNIADELVLLLNNTLYLPEVYLEQGLGILKLDELANISNQELREIISDFPFLIFGGTGFTGKDKRLNNKEKISNANFITLREEIKEKEIVDRFHKKLLKVSRDMKVIFVTYDYDSNWSNEHSNPNWIYLSSIKNHNFKGANKTQMYLADKDNSSALPSKFNFKIIPYLVNKFENYSDGLHEIEMDDYISFYKKLWKKIDINKAYRSLYLLKNNNTYCFFIELENGKLRMLDGGNVKDIGKLNIEDFESKLSNYVSSVKKFMDPYFELYEKVYKEIDYFFELDKTPNSTIKVEKDIYVYIDPIDRQIIPYTYEESQYLAFENFPSLIKYKNPEMHETYIKIQEEFGYNRVLYPKDYVLSKKTKVLDKSKINKTSRVISSLYFTYKHNVVRLWNHEVEPDGTDEKGKDIVEGLLKK
ncbi:hypothetical protein [Mycoplasmopsis agassizii]|uniref:SIR2-like domain-containing protein n=1 Tax=Mycoplasmopsis agassizii TaxID=33922 RepID=A0ABX4H515_9BACT|nr:hypothetical protein [Mycoplasmopsis agassizii]PAF54984.1 hypothetical protein CJF60_04605 [Mycoplasmopsis agassizii]SMC17644.1 hypothetical protein SAMN02745179_00518 [Mycoplasmopsis agassizii]